MHVGSDEDAAFSRCLVRLFPLWPLTMTRPQPCDNLMNIDVGLLAITSAVVLMFRLLVTVPVPDRTLRVLERVVPLLFTVAQAVLNEMVVQSGREHV